LGVRQRERISFTTFTGLAKLRQIGFCYAYLQRASKILPASELKAAKSQLSQDQYDQEYECSFEAAILGAFYGTEMRQVDDEGRVRDLKFDPDAPVFTAWDLGYRDDTAIWWYQVVRGEIHVMDYYAVSGASIEEIANVVNSKGYRYTKHFLPHDARAKTLPRGASQSLNNLLVTLGGMAN
jgi:phage terminase large subunit